MTVDQTPDHRIARNATPAKPLLILKVGDALPEAVARGGDFEHWIAQAFGPGPQPPLVVDARLGALLPAYDTIAGVVVTGSAAMVTERETWSEALVPWLKAAVARATPVLGICYGHQLLAHALGGEVGCHPGGMEIGTVQIRKSRIAAGDPLFDAVPDEFAAQVVHSQSVRRLPPGAVCLAANDYEHNHAFRYGDRAWGVQFHPEFDTEAIYGYIRKFAVALAANGRDPSAIAREVRATPAAAGVLRRFALLATET